MLYNYSFSKDFCKIRKLWSEKGAKIVVQKVCHLAGKKLIRSSKKRTMAKRDFIFKSLDRGAVRKDFENFFYTGLFRPLDEIRSGVRSLTKEYADLILEEALKVLKNEFKIYGYRQLQYDTNRFSWTYDPLTDFKWPQTLSWAFVRSKKPHGTDIKTIWEIARFQFLSPLAYAYILTDERRYANFAIHKVKSWIEKNMFLSGPHWMMPMEASIRLMNWCVYLPLLDILKLADANLKEQITLSIIEHLVYIKENLEYSPSYAGNHYLADISGLLIAKLLFPSQQWAIESTNFAINEFNKEIQKQFKPSGINFEGSFQYHRLTCEMALFGVASIKRTGEIVPQGIVKRIKQVSHFTRYYTEICNEIPLIGDNDSGIFLRFFPGQDLNQHGYLNCLFDSILENNGKTKNFNEFLCSIHFTPTEKPDSCGFEQSNNTNVLQLRVIEFDGLIIARNRSEAIFINALNSSEGHSHNDKLSVYPVICGKLLFLDRGSYSYTGYRDIRQLDRMSSAHNGPVVNNWEQNTIWEEDPFYINGEAKCSSSVEKNGSTLVITCNHIGYERFRKGLKTYRKIEWNTKKRFIEIEDWLECEASQEIFQIKLHFLINPIWEIQILDNNCFAFTYKDQTVYLEDLDKIDFKIIQDHYCPAYQLEKPCEALNACSKIGVDEKIRFRLRY